MIKISGRQNVPAAVPLDAPVVPVGDKPVTLTRVEAGFEAPAGAPKVELSGNEAAAVKEPARATRLGALFEYSKSHAPGKVVMPGVPEAPPLPGKRLLVVNKGPNQGAPGDSSIMLMDLESGKLLKKIATEQGPHEVMVSPDGRLAVAPNYGLQTQGTGVETGGGETLTVVDLVREEASTLKLPGYFRPHGVEWLDDTHVAVTVDAKGRDLSSGYVLVVDVKKGKIEREYRTGEAGTHLVRHSPDGKYLYASNIQGGSFSRIDRATGEVKTLKTGQGTEGFDFSPDGKEIWTGNLEESTFSIIDVESFTEKQKVSSPGVLPIRFKFVSKNLLLVANRGSNDLSFIDPRTQQPIGRQVKFDLSRFGAAGPELDRTSVPMQIELSDDKRFAFVANSHSGMVSMVDLSSREVVGYYLAGNKPDPIAVYEAPEAKQVPLESAVRGEHLKLAAAVTAQGLRPNELVLAPPAAGKRALEAVTVMGENGQPHVAVVVRSSSPEVREAAERLAADLGTPLREVEQLEGASPISPVADVSQRTVFARALGIADRLLKNAGVDAAQPDRQLFRYAVARFVLNGTTPQGLAWLASNWKGDTKELMGSGLLSDRWRTKLERDLTAPYKNAEMFTALVDLDRRVKVAVQALKERFPAGQMQFYVAGSPTKGRLGASSDIDLMISTKDPELLKAALSKSYVTQADPKEIFDIGEYEEFVRRGKYFGTPVPIGDGAAVLARPDFLTRFYVDHSREEWGLSLDAKSPDVVPPFEGAVVEKFVRESPEVSETLYGQARAYRKHVDIAFVAKYLEHLEDLDPVASMPANRLSDYGDQLLEERLGAAGPAALGRYLLTAAGKAVLSGPRAEAFFAAHPDAKADVAAFFTARADLDPRELFEPLALCDALSISAPVERLMVEFASARRTTRLAT